MAKISISQVEGTHPPQFTVTHLENHKHTSATEIPSPYDWPVPHGGVGKLMDQLRWHLETFLSYPFSPYTEKSEHIQAALKTWGEAAFAALFNNRTAGSWLPSNANAVFDILITCDDPQVLSWPWEALCDPALGFFAHRARIQRRLSFEIPPSAPPPDLPMDRIRILLVTARPYANDVGYRSISRALVDLIREENVPAEVQVLRPPTLDELRRHLLDHPNHYHILHFDGHGGYGSSAPDPSHTTFKGNEGRLLFENEQGEADEVTAGKLAEALQGCSIPYVVLNACRSAQVDSEALDGKAFASVAGALVRAGFRGALAMGYNLTVTGAKVFLPPFYRHLFRTGHLMEAAREGRREMFLKPVRSTWNPQAELQDWLLPVVYQQEDFELKFAGSGELAPEGIALPEEALVRDTLTFVGRDGAIQHLERSLRRRAAATLIHGMGGMGKTTLTRHFLQWMRDTGGLHHPPFWFSFDDIRNATYVLNQMGRALLGPGFDGDEKNAYQSLVQVLRQHPVLIVWDNFESARGLAVDHVSSQLTGQEQERLKQLLVDLHGGKTKVLITSRSEESWLPADHCRRLSLGGLRGAELWEYAAQVLDLLEIKANKKDPDLLALLQDMEGHPVLVRCVLVQLANQSAASLRQTWQQKLPEFLAQGTDAAHARLLSSQALMESAFSAEEQSYLIPLGLHERFVDLDYLHAMGEAEVAGYTPSTMERVIARLERMGLLAELGNRIFSIHPLLTSHLRATAYQEIEREAWERRFVDIMSTLADHYAPKQLHEQRGFFDLHHANCHRAFKFAEVHKVDASFAALTQALATFALNTGDHAEAAQLFTSLATHREQLEDSTGEAGAYHQLGIIAQKQRQFSTAGQWYLKSLAIEETQGNEHGMASTYHQLGIIAQEQRQFPTAEQWYLKSLAISEKQGNDHFMALTHGQLGKLKIEQQDWAPAMSLALTAFVSFHRLNDPHSSQMAVGDMIQILKSAPAEARSGLEGLVRESLGEANTAMLIETAKPEE